MMTSSNGNIFRVTGPLCGEFTGPGEFPTQRPVTRSFDVLFDLRLNKRLSKQPWGWWFETPARSLWRQRNVENITHYTTNSWFIMVFCIIKILSICSPRLTHCFETYFCGCIIHFLSMDEHLLFGQGLAQAQTENHSWHQRQRWDSSHLSDEYVIDLVNYL